MYTVEFDHDEVSITILDDSGVHGDLKVKAYDDFVYITQDDPENDIEYILEINPVTTSGVYPDEPATVGLPTSPSWNIFCKTVLDGLVKTGFI